MTKEYTNIFGDSLGDVLRHAMKAETTPKGICKCRLLFAKESQTDMWVWLTWGGYGKLMGIGSVHHGKLSFETTHDGDKIIAIPTNHQAEPFSIKGLLVPSVGDIPMWQKLFDIEDERPTMAVVLNGSTINTLVDIEEGHHNVG